MDRLEVYRSTQGDRKSLVNKDNFHVVVIKSTVILGTAEEIVKPIVEKAI